MPISGRKPRLPAALLLVVWLVSGCAVRPPPEQPAVVLAGVHSGGSALGFSHSGTLLASGGWEGNIHLWKMPDGKPAGYWRAHGDSVNGIAFSAGDEALITAGYDGDLAAWTLGGRLIRRVATPVPVTHMEADPAADRVLTGHSDGSVRLWRLSDFSLLEERQPHHGSVRAVAIDRNMPRYASSGADGSVVIWSESGAVSTLQDPPTDAWTLAFSPDGSYLFGGTWFRLLRWDLASRALVTLPTEHLGIIRSIRFTASGDKLASISRQTDSSVYLLDPDTGAAIRRFRPHEMCGAAISVSPDTHFLATTSDDASVRIWNLEVPGNPAP